MGCLGNILWFVFGGCLSGLSWLLAGILWCITIVGIPIGMQCFKFAGLSFFSIREGSTLWRRSRLPAAEYSVAAAIRTSAGDRISHIGCGALLYHHRDSVWIAAF